jgi:ubiquinone/menaquinone biosynthesis C-methylase UbiE
MSRVRDNDDEGITGSNEQHYARAKNKIEILSPIACCGGYLKVRNEIDPGRRRPIRKTFMVKEKEEDLSLNHSRYAERKALFARFGYDIDKERNFILRKARPICGQILEAGTGKGHFTLALAKAGYRVTTFDISDTEQAFARMNLRYLGLEPLVSFYLENGEALRFPEGSFDIIFSVNTLHHLSNPYKVIDELIRVLSAGGKLVISDFTAKGFAVLDKIHASEGRTHEVSPVSLSDIKQHLIAGGFLVESVRSKYQAVLIGYHATR